MSEKNPQAILLHFGTEEACHRRRENHPLVPSPQYLKGLPSGATEKKRPYFSFYWVFNRDLGILKMDLYNPNMTR